MSRLIRNTAVLAKIESSYGTDPTPTGSANAILVSDLSISPVQAQNVDRNLMRPYLGASEMLIGTTHVQCSFSVELVGSGTAGDAPNWGPLLRACGMAQTLTATTRVDYTPVSTAFDSVTIYWHDDGVLHKLLGARGTARVMLKLGEIPRMQFTFTGIDGGITEASNPSVTLTGFLQPQVVFDTPTGDLTLGGTHSTTLAPAFASGTSYVSTGLELDIGNQVVHNPWIGAESVDLTNRAVSGRIEIRATAAQEVALVAAAKAGTLQSIGMLHGTVTGRKAGIWMPSVQLLNPGKGDRNGVRTATFDVRALPVSGNDEVRVITSF